MACAEPETYISTFDLQVHMVRLHACRMPTPGDTGIVPIFCLILPLPRFPAFQPFRYVTSERAFVSTHEQSFCTTLKRLAVAYLNVVLLLDLKLSFYNV